MSVVLDENTYSFFNIDQLFDFITSIGMRPLVELSFMPKLLASGNDTVFHYEGNTTPPKSYQAWFNLVQALVQHLVDRYGLQEIRQWNFEVWNEPQCGFWSGDQAEYFELFNWTATAVKSVDSQISVGGPATCQSGWIPDLLNFTATNKVPIDFISTHEYPTDLGDQQTRDTMLNVFTKARQQAGNMPLYYTEYNDGLYSNPDYHEVSYAAAFIIKTAHDGQGLVDTLSWWTFTDIFEEQGMSSAPFQSGPDWGLLSRYGIPKPSYRAFEFLHMAGDKEAVVTGGDNTTVGAFALVGVHDLMVFFYNIDVPGNPISPQSINVTISGQTLENGRIWYIDDDHVNPVAAWTAMGKPTYPTFQQIAQLVESSYVKASPAPCTSQSQTSNCGFTIAPQSAVVLTFSL